MARIALSPKVLDDFDRFIEHLNQHEAENVPAPVAGIIQALQILTHSPLIGRKVKGGKRELVIGQGSRGYTALYRFVAAIDTVFVLALRGQREVGFKSNR